MILPRPLAAKGLDTQTATILKKDTPDLLRVGRLPHDRSRDLRQPLVLRLFPEMRERIGQLIALRTTIEQAMEDLKMEYNRSVPPTRLRLRPWSKLKGMAPYAVYWILIHRRRKFTETVVDRALARLTPRKYKRIRIGDRRGMNRAMYQGGLYDRRELVLAFDRRARAINEAHRTVACALYDLRRMLDSRAAGKGDQAPLPLLPPECNLDRSDPPAHKLYPLLWRFFQTILIASENLRTFAIRYGKEGLPDNFRLGLRQAPGELLGSSCQWQLPGRRSKRGNLRFCDLRELHVTHKDQKAIMRVEMERRPLARQCQTKSKLLGRIRAKASLAIMKANRLLGEAHEGQKG